MLSGQPFRILQSNHGPYVRICQVIYSQFGLAIHQNDHQARRRFVEWAQNEIAVVPDFHKRILFNDEAQFWLNGYVNKQNCHIWSEANRQVYVETPLHPEKLTSLVYADKPQTLDHLEDNIRRVIADIRPQMLEKVSENWTSRLDYIRASRGSPMPEIIFKISMPLKNTLDKKHADEQFRWCGHYVSTTNSLRWPYKKKYNISGDRSVQRSGHTCPIQRLNHSISSQLRTGTQKKYANEHDYFNTSAMIEKKKNTRRDREMRECFTEALVNSEQLHQKRLGSPESNSAARRMLRDHKVNAIIIIVT
ncbi:hypothetical protein TNCV_845681 [Trichonephila clavipes]|nr:hypothetical protein TNCV_845681 [Trichonephila clavipes]